MEQKGEWKEMSPIDIAILCVYVCGIIVGAIGFGIWQYDSEFSWLEDGVPFSFFNRDTDRILIHGERNILAPFHQNDVLPVEVIIESGSVEFLFRSDAVHIKMGDLSARDIIFLCNWSAP